MTKLNLYIDTSEFGETRFALSDSEQVISQKVFPIKPMENHKILEFLDKFLGQSKITLLPNSPLEGEGRGGVIRQIIVNKGPGSFTGVRTGIAIAQALALAWKVPIRFLNDKQFEKAITKK